MINKEYVLNLNYPDFVGLVNQWNVPPGSYDTLSRWITYGRVNVDSNILEIACTTGFSVRELVNLTNAKGTGFDLSHKAIENAEYNRDNYTKGLDLNFLQANGYEFDSKGKKYSHIIVGAALKFFPDPELMMEKAVDLLDDGGYLFASPFYGVKDMPDEVKDRAKKIFGFNITSEPYDKIMTLYSKLERVYEERKEMKLESDDEIKHYCKSTIDLAVKKLNIDDEDTYKAMFDRLYEVRQMSNELRTYQEYSVLVLRYRKNIYPNRLVELF